MSGDTFRALFAALLVLVGCGDDAAAPMPDAGPGETDAGVDAPGCGSDSECDDGLYCNGTETCTDGACAAGTPVDCDDGMTCTLDGCDEATRACTHGSPDADGDGFLDASCGGDDCDDAEAARNPGATEVCDAADLDEDCNAATYGATDLDRDGHDDAACCNGTTCGDDCADGIAGIHPGVPEVCNGLDDDCDGTFDETATVAAFADADGDGHGTGSATMVCAGTAGYATTGDDCDDADPRRYPGLLEVCDAIDNDCDTVVDDDPVPATWYRDADGDSFGDAGGGTVVSCAPVAGHSLLPFDCDDADAARGPGAPELCNGRDDDCNGIPDYEIAPGDREDDDADGYADAMCPAGDDCGDSDEYAYPGAPELCDGVDNDCDGMTDEDPSDVVWYRDVDRDRAGDPAVTVTSCERQPGHVLAGGDCDDADRTRHPRAVDVCDGVDQDCDGSFDESASRRAFYADADMDGIGAGTVVLACRAPVGHVTLPGDCDDTDAAVDATLTRFFVDADGDTYGAGAEMSACRAPAGSAARAGDCDDTAAAVNPGASETCNMVDDDCDAMIDDSPIGADWYLDADGDTFGAGSPVVSCTMPAMHVAVAGDCDDTAAAVNPAALEACNAIDDDCDGTVDDGAGTVWYADADGDTWGNAAVTITACAAPAGYVARSGDCNDANGAISPDATEVCNLTIDDDCDGTIDDGFTTTWYRDMDGDTYGTSTTTMRTCTMPAGYVGRGGDCADSNAAVSPGATEICNALDDDCDGVTNEAGAEASCVARPNSTPSCGATACTLVCNPSYGNCNAVEADGCEVDLRTTASDCGTCGNDCGLGDTCTASACDDVPVVEVVVGGGYTCARRANGLVACWGRNNAGQLGDGTILTRTRPVLVPISGAVAISAGDSHTCAILGTGAVVCWGNNGTGQLGDGTLVNRPSPTPVMTAIIDFVEIVAGGEHTCARRATGEIYCWGRGHVGQIGDGSTMHMDCSTIVGYQDCTPVPMPVSGIADATQLSARDHTTLALRADGTIMCWGQNTTNECGIGSSTPAIISTPRAVLTAIATPLTGVVDVGIGTDHGCAVLSTGRVRCWGINGSGRLGTGDTMTRVYADSEVLGLLDATQVSGAVVNTCARRMTGEIACWGANGNGQLGNGTTTGSTTPIAVTGVLDALFVDARAYLTAHTCARRGPTGAVWCWGANNVGQLGDGTTLQRTSPVATSGMQ